MNEIAQRLLTPAECQAWLSERLPAWTLHTGEERMWIQRAYRTRSWSMTLQAANTVGFLAEIGWHHPRLILEYNLLQVELYSHDVNGITLRDMELAYRIEEVLTWLPRPEDALTGHARRRLV